MPEREKAEELCEREDAQFLLEQVGTKGTNSFQVFNGTVEYVGLRCDIRLLSKFKRFEPFVSLYKKGKQSNWTAFTSEINS